MSESAERLLKSIQRIEVELATIKQALKYLGVKEEGLIGTFDGEYINLEDGRRFPIPPNYASKSMLVAGDTLRMIEDPNGGDQHRYKQIAKVERGKSVGILTRKDGKFEVVSEEGSFKVMTAAVNHFEAEVGDSLMIHFAQNHPKGSWAAIEKKVTSTPQAGPQTVANQPISATTISHATSAEPAAPASTVPPQPQPSPVAVAPEATTSPQLAPEVAADTAAVKVSPKQADQSSKQESKSAKNKRSKSRSKSKAKTAQSSNDTARPAQPAPKKPLPSDQPLSVDQGEIAIPTVIDEDDLT